MQPSRYRHRHTVGLNRRELLQVGYSGFLGLGLPALFSQQSRAATADGSDGGVTRKPKSIVLIFLTGAASHHDTFDMKPEAPQDIRGEFQPIATSVPNLHICEHLPRLAERAHKYALIRTLSHNDNNHLMSTHYVLTGELQPGGFFDKVASRDDWPCYAAACAYLRPRRDGIPTGVNLPAYLVEGPLTWPGQHAGLLGPNYDPWQIAGDPNRRDFRVDNLTLSPGIDVGRLGDRQSLLGSLNRQQEKLAAAAASRRLTSEQELAFSILTSSRLGEAFRLDGETKEVRDRYGRTTTGQSLLLARRLVEVGVPVVQVNVGQVQTWDNHSNIFPTLKQKLLPPLDQGVAALLDDLETRGLLAESFVLMLGEFGRTPKINATRGRDHWGNCFFGLFAGAGVRGGQVIGQSDKLGAYPLTPGYSPHDIGATVYHALNLPLDAEVRDRFDRPVRLNRGTVIQALFSGAAV